MVESIGIEITTKDIIEQEGSGITKKDDYDNTKVEFELKDEIVSNMNMRGGTTEKLTYLGQNTSNICMRGGTAVELTYLGQNAKMENTAKHMHNATVPGIDGMHRVMEYCLNTPDRGLTLKPNEKWDGSKDFKFKIRGRANSDYAKDPETRRSVTVTRVSLNGSVTQFRSATQKFVTLSVTEAEQAAAVTCAQDMVYQKNLLESIGLQVELPMILEVDNKGAVDLANNWSVGG